MLIRAEIVKSTFIISDPEVVFPFFFKMLTIFDKDHMNFPWQPNRKNSSNFTAKNVLLTFQMEQNGTFYETF